MSDAAAGWLAEMDELFAETLARVTNDQFEVPTALAGWTRAHVIAHVHFNALALCRLVGWAETGVESAMYASDEQRAEEIEDGATYPPEQLRELVAGSAERFSSAFGRLSDAALERIVTTAQGRRIPAREIAWLRCRELGVHAVDLDAGTSFADLPAGFTSALVHEIIARRVSAGEGPTLAAWLTGRRQDAQPLDRWL